MGLSENMRVSIAEHSYAVTYLSMIFAKMENVDDSKLVRYCMVHDWSDCVIGDLPSGSPSWRSFWEVDIRKETKIAETKVWEAMKELVKEEINLSDFGRENLSEKEIVIFEAADITGMLLEMMEWIYMGVKHDGWEMVWFNSLDRLKKMDLSFVPKLVEELSGAIKKGSKDYNVFLAQPAKQTNPEHKT